MNWTLWTAFGSFFAALGVGFGAFGAHALKSRLPIEDLAIFEVGVRYQMYHALALLFVGFLASKMDSSLIKIAGWLFVAGIVLFSGSLYTLVFTGVRTWGAVTPIGGLAFIVAWLLVGIAVIKS
ncbi:MAG: DUF423 domain-containing protein [Chitinophagaceae bacterium]|nr:DUF423 domain-containing protein [Oligoflexus sp.]